MKTIKIVCLLLLAVLSVGCTTIDKMKHELQPHRLWRMNRQDKPGRADAAFYSISDSEVEDALSKPSCRDLTRVEIQHSD